MFVAALGNNSVEVIDIGARTRVHSITGIPNPQGVVYAPETRNLRPVSKGQLYIYDAATLELVKAIEFHGDVDNLRYDVPNQRVYVGFGDDETGAIGSVDATRMLALTKTPTWTAKVHPANLMVASEGDQIWTVRGCAIG